MAQNLAKYQPKDFLVNLQVRIYENTMNDRSIIVDSDLCLVSIKWNSKVKKDTIFYY